MNEEDLRRPFIRFETVAVELPGAAGIQYVDKDYIILVPHGSEGKTELREEYDFWADKMEKQCGPQRTPGGDSGKIGRAHV